MLGNLTAEQLKEVYEYEYKLNLEEAVQEAAQEAEEKMADAIKYLLENGRNEDVLRIASDKEYRKEVFDEIDREMHSGQISE